MNKYNIFEYILLLITPSVFAYQLAKAFYLFFNYFVSSIELPATIKSISKEKSLNSFWPFFYVVEYTLNGERLEANLKGFVTPFAYRIGDTINVLLNKKNKLQVITVTFKGQLSRIIFGVVLLILLIVGSMYCLNLLELIHFGQSTVNVVPFLFLILAILMLMHTIYFQCTLRKRSAVVEGIVKDMTEVLDNEYNRAYRPTIEYSVNEKVFRTESDILYYDKKMLGRKISVIFFIDIPQFGEINSFEFKWLHLIFWFALFLTSLVAVLIRLNFIFNP